MTTFAQIAQKLEALVGIAKAVAPEAAAQIDAAASDVHGTVQATEAAVSTPTVGTELLQTAEAIVEPDVESFVTKLLTPVYKTNAAAVAAKFVSAGEAAITAI